MTAVLDILKRSGAVSVGSLAQAATVTFTHRVYNAINSEQFDTAVVLTAEAASIADALTAEFAEAGADNVSVMVCNEQISKGKNKGGAKTVKTLVAGIERRNALNSDHLDDTFGSVNLPADGGIYNDSGDLIGFTVQAA